MRYQITSTGNIVLADQAFMDANHPGDYTPLPEPSVDVVAPVVPWTKKEFQLRFTPAEYAAIKAATATNFELDYYWSLFIVADEVSRTDPVTIAGINMLEQVGLIAAGRAAEILGA